MDAHAAPLMLRDPLRFNPLRQARTHFKYDYSIQPGRKCTDCDTGATAWPPVLATQGVPGNYRLRTSSEKPWHP